MITPTPIVLLRGKLGCPVLAMDRSGIPRVLAWIPAEKVDALLCALKIPREDEEISFDAFRAELLK